MTDYRINVLRKAALCRHFENKVFDLVQERTIRIPVYLSAGQEYVAAPLAQMFAKRRPMIFGQHRAHSVYLSFGGRITGLIDELLGRKCGCANGMGGSASIQGDEISMYGHDGLMGTQVPIAVGACFSTGRPTIVFVGDGAAEEDYVLAAIAWAGTKKLPILFVVDDNNLSILTRKEVRRNWSLVDVAKAFTLESFDVQDDPMEIQVCTARAFEHPMLLNINTHRLYWHAGAGSDSDNTFDRYKEEVIRFGRMGQDIDDEMKQFVKAAWEQQLEKQ